MFKPGDKVRRIHHDFFEVICGETYIVSSVNKFGQLDFEGLQVFGYSPVNFELVKDVPEQKELVTEDISKPKRYNKTGKLECWDVILDQKMDFLEGSVLKYLWRYKEKNGIQDLKKAIVYLEKMIEREENEK